MGPDVELVSLGFLSSNFGARRVFRVSSRRSFTFPSVQLSRLFHYQLFIHSSSQVGTDRVGAVSGQGSNEAMCVTSWNTFILFTQRSLAPDLLTVITDIIVPGIIVMDNVSLLLSFSLSLAYFLIFWI